MAINLAKIAAIKAARPHLPQPAAFAVKRAYSAPRPVNTEAFEQVERRRKFMPREVSVDQIAAVPVSPKANPNSPWTGNRMLNRQRRNERRMDPIWEYIKSLPPIQTVPIGHNPRPRITWEDAEPMLMPPWLVPGEISAPGPVETVVDDPFLAFMRQRMRGQY